MKQSEKISSLILFLININLKNINMYVFFFYICILYMYLFLNYSKILIVLNTRDSIQKMKKYKYICYGK